MYRNVINDFVSWYDEARRRILIVKGAYGVGKTWSVKDFATAFFKHQYYVDLSEHSDIKSLVSDTYTDSNEEQPEITEKSNLFHQKLCELFPQHDFDNINSIIIFDGIGDISGYAEFFHVFRKEHKNYTLCLISDSMNFTEYEYHYKDVFNIIRMRPMTFEEYMIANKSHPVITALENQKSTPIGNIGTEAACILLKEYLQTGGMPEVVKAFIPKKDYSVIRPIQLAILEGYRKLIKNSLPDTIADRCRRIWSSVPKQLTNDNKKFMYRLVESNARAREYAEATQKLCDLGLVRKLPRLAEGILPLEEHVDYRCFELFMLDHGLLRASYELPISDELSVEEILTEANGAIAEQYSFQELSGRMGNIYYWVSGATARVPFVYEGSQSPIPVDIRLKPNKKAQNIKTFRSKNHDVEFDVKISLEQYSKQDNTINIPAFGIWSM